MPYGERETLCSLITTLIVTILFLWRLSGQHEAGLFDSPEVLRIWAGSVLILVAWSIGIAIVVAIGFHIGHAALTGERPDERRDERDHLIDRRALTFAWYFLSFGILGVIIALALGASAFLAMNMILGLCALSEICKDGVKLWLYRREA